MKKFTTLIIICLTAVLVAACGEEPTPTPTATPAPSVAPTETPEPVIVSEKQKSGDYEYSVYSDGVAMVTAYSGKEKQVSIPESIDGKSVAEIGEAVFADKKIEGVVIPATVKKIGRKAFNGCTELGSVSIPDTVEYIGYAAFKNTRWLTEQEDKFVVVGDKILIAYNGESDDVKISNGVKMVADAFEADGSSTRKPISAIQLSGSIKVVGERAFAGCVDIDEVILSENVEILGDEAFSGCTSLKSVHIPRFMDKIGKNCFSNCVSLEEINIPKGVLTIGEGAFKKCEMLPEIELPSTMEKIEDLTFDGCAGLKEITIPDTVKEISNTAFNGCSKGLVVCGKESSVAQDYANKNEFKFVTIGE